MERLRRYEHDEAMRFRPPVSRAYPDEPVRGPSDSDGGAVDVALTALYGVYGVLPDYFTDELQGEGKDRQALRDFLDMFNHRLMRLMYDTWRRYRFFSEDVLDPKSERAKLEAAQLNRITGLLGDRDDPPYLRGLRWGNMGMYRRATRSSGALMDLLRAFLPGFRIDLESFVAQFRDIPSEQHAVLGRNIRIGAEGSFLVGRRIKDIAGGVRLTFRDLDYETYMRLLPGGSWRGEIADLVKDFTRGRADALIKLELRGDQVPDWQLGQRQLGMNLWLKSRPMAEPVTVSAGVL